MLKTRLLYVLFIFVATSLVHADVYRCEEDGRVIFTDNPTNLSSDCKAESKNDVRPLNVIPSPPGKPVKSKAPTRHSATATEQKQQNDMPSLYEGFKEETEILVDEFISKRKQVFRSTLTQDKQKARRELSEIRSQKSLLISAIDKSKLTRSQKTELKTKLSAITD